MFNGDKSTIEENDLFSSRLHYLGRVYQIYIQQNASNNINRIV